jgi:hypothetical protein
VNTLKRQLTVANVLSCIALFVALAGSAYAATQLKRGQVKAVNIAPQAVTNSKLKTQAVTSGKIKNLGINSADLGTGSVINSKIGKKAVTNSKLGSEAVGASKLAKKSVTTNAIAPEAINAAKISGSLWTQLVRNVSYFNSASITNGEANKAATVECPAGKEAIAGGGRLEGELASVALTASYPVSVGALRAGWSAIAHESGGGPFGDWSIVAFVVCAEI